MVKSMSDFQDIVNFIATYENIVASFRSRYFAAIQSSIDAKSSAELGMKIYSKNHIVPLSHGQDINPDPMGLIDYKYENCRDELVVSDSNEAFIRLLFYIMARHIYEQEEKEKVRLISMIASQGHITKDEIGNILSRKSLLSESDNELFNSTRKNMIYGVGKLKHRGRPYLFLSDPESLQIDSEEFSHERMKNVLFFLSNWFAPLHVVCERLEARGLYDRAWPPI